jgi:hypothetical protein
MTLRDLGDQEASEDRLRPPEILEEWIRRYGLPAEDGSGDGVLDGAVKALHAALDRPGRNRDGAYALLAADALLTRACQEAARAGDPEAELVAILERLRREGLEGEGEG